MRGNAAHALAAAPRPRTADPIVARRAVQSRESCALVLGLLPSASKRVPADR